MARKMLGRRMGENMKTILFSLLLLAGTANATMITFEGQGYNFEGDEFAAQGILFEEGTISLVQGVQALRLVDTVTFTIDNPGTVTVMVAAAEQGIFDFALTAMDSVGAMIESSMMQIASSLGHQALELTGLSGAQTFSVSTTLAAGIGSVEFTQASIRSVPGPGTLGIMLIGLVALWKVKRTS